MGWKKNPINLNYKARAPYHGSHKQRMTRQEMGELCMLAKAITHIPSFVTPQKSMPKELIHYEKIILYSIFTVIWPVETFITIRI